MHACLNCVEHVNKYCTGILVLSLPRLIPNTYCKQLLHNFVDCKPVLQDSVHIVQTPLLQRSGPVFLVANSQVDKKWDQNLLTSTENLMLLA